MTFPLTERDVTHTMQSPPHLDHLGCLFERLIAIVAERLACPPGGVDEGHGWFWSSGWRELPW